MSVLVLGEGGPKARNHSIDELRVCVRVVGELGGLVAAPELNVKEKRHCLRFLTR